MSTTLRIRMNVPALWTSRAWRAEWLQESLFVEFDPGCVVPDDPGEVVRHARPADEWDRRRIREQQIARMRLDSAAIRAREQRMRAATASAPAPHRTDDAHGC